MPRRAPRPAATTVAAAVLLLLTAACGDADPDPSPEAPPSSAGGSASAEPTSTEMATSGGSAPTSPAASNTFGVEPASGPVIETDAFRLNVPAGWEVAEQVSSFVSLATRQDGVGELSLGYLEAADGSTLGREEATVRKLWIHEGPQVLPHRTVAGVEMYHLAGAASGGLWIDTLGAPHAGLSVDLTFRHPVSMPKRQRDALVDSVLASIEWK